MFASSKLGVGKGQEFAAASGGTSGCPGGVSGLAGSLSSASMRSIHQKDEPIMPNAHKAILTLLLDWSKEVPFDLKRDPCFKQELNDLLSRIALLGEQYQWKAEEIRISLDLQVSKIVSSSRFRGASMFSEEKDW